MPARTSRVRGARSRSFRCRGRQTRPSAILYAPWEGRPHPTRAELDLLTLVGQHAGTALEHSLLYARVRSQADELNRLAAVQADFLRGVTHDLQTPLTSIGALATELRADSGVPEAARDDLDSITHQADRLRRMVEPAPRRLAPRGRRLYAAAARSSPFGRSSSERGPRSVPIGRSS